MLAAPAQQKVGPPPADLATRATVFTSGSAPSMAGWWFGAGPVLFSGSLYAMALTGHRALGAITPLGGVAFLSGWLCLALGARRGA